MDDRIYCLEHRGQPLAILFALLTTIGGTLASYAGSGWFSGWSTRSTPTPVQWVRITESRDLQFDGNLVVIPKGSVSGTTSDPRASVFLLSHVVRACWGAFDCTDYQPQGNYWRASEMSVDAQGNWRGAPCQYPWHGERQIASDLQYWELLAVALDDAATLKDHVGLQDCSIGEEALLELPALACSESVVAMHGQPNGYSPHYELAPHPRRYCFGREIPANGPKVWIRIGDIGDVRFDPIEASAQTQRLHGRVTGGVSTGAVSVFLVQRLARQCFAEASAGGGPAKGAVLTSCHEREPANENWSIVEAATDAAGNWSAEVESDESRNDGAQAPWVEFWQFQAFATAERQRVADRITPWKTISSIDIQQFVPNALCSEPRIMARSKVFSGYWRMYEPTNLPGLCHY